MACAEGGDTERQHVETAAERDRKQRGRRGRPRRVLHGAVLRHLGVLGGGGIGPVALVIGSLGAVCIIVTFCVFLNFFKPIASFLQAIPLVCITSAFATFLFIKVATMH